MPVKWRTLIETYEPPNHFVDMQLSGPDTLWHHTHTFEAAEGGTWMTDVVRYQIALGPLGTLAHILFVKKMLIEIFDYRRDRIEELLIKHSTS